MLKIIKYLKNSKLAVVAIIALLVLQATCELALPQYTANIVDVGLQQGGIEKVAPERMREETLATISYFMTEAELETVSAHYEADGAGVLTRTTDGQQDLEDIEAALVQPMAALALAGQAVSGLFGAVQSQEGKEAVQALPGGAQMTLSSLVGSGALDEHIDAQALNLLQGGGLLSGALGQIPLAMLNGMASATGETAAGVGALGAVFGRYTHEEMLFFREYALAQLGESGEMMSRQMAIQLVKMEYEATGVDLGRMQTNYLILSGAKMLGVTLGMVAAAVLVGFLAARVAASIGQRLRGDVFSKVVSFAPGDVSKFSTASLITRNTNDIQQVQMTAVMILRMVAYAPILGIGGVLKVAATRTGLSWIVFAAVGALLVLVGILLVVAMPKFNVMQTRLDRVNQVAREILTGLPVIRAFNREERENERFAEASTDLMQTQLFTSRTMTFMMPMMMLIMNGITLMIVWFGAKGIDAGTLQVGSMMAFITYTMQIVMSFLMLTMLSVMLPRAIVSANRIQEVIETPATVGDAEKVKDEDRQDWEGVVAFEDVSFRYPDAEQDTLTDVTFTAKTGQTTAIIGSTGSGKSTLLNLIPRFFDVTQGRVTLDGVDIRDLSQHKLRSLLGYVPQKGVLFSGDIASNIKFGGSDITDEAMIEAAEIAQAVEFIEEKSEKYSDPIAQGGTNVSGGQKQRLSIARAIAKHPKVLLFDDSFSALDYRTDLVLRRALHERVKDATVIIVAQRISTVLHADQIVVLDEGQMVGIGTHGELMRSCPVYQEIAKSQLSEEELKGGRGA